MNKMILNAAVGVALFAGTLFGTLAATGRLNHEGTAGIPLLSGLFPPPPPAVDEHGQPVDASASKTEAAGPVEASQPQGNGQEPQGKGSDERLPLKGGKSIFESKDKPADGSHGEAPGGQGEAAKAEPHTAPAPGNGAAPPPAAPPGGAHADPGERAVAQDFQQLQGELQATGNGYRIGEYFRFEGMPAGITPEQLDQAWRRVQQATAELEQRKTALDLRERDLQVQEKDVSRRQSELGRERQSLEALQKSLDQRIAEFKAQVTVVKLDEMAALKRNAGSFQELGPQKGAELVQEWWKTQGGQEQVVKYLELMEAEAVDKLLAQLPNTLIKQVLDKRLHTSREQPKGGAKR